MNTAVLGAGSFGTALAMQLARCGHSVRLWERSPARARLIEKTRMNERYLPGYRLDSAVSVGSDVDWVLANAELAVLAIPSQALREALTNLRPHLPQDTILCCAAKGVEQGSLLTMEEVMSQVLETDRRICVISGPSFAAEVARGEPTAVVVAGKDPSATKRGMADGMGLGLNARAAIITRGLAEITRLGVAKGANPLTFSGLAGMGDLVLTCTGDLSRNRRVGLALGQGQTLEQVLEELGQVAEGVVTTRSARSLGHKLGVELPITEQVYGILYEGQDPKQAMAALMGRAQKHERG